MPEGPLKLLLPALVRLGPIDLHNDTKAGRGALVAQLEQRAIGELELSAVIAAEEEVVTGDEVEASSEVLEEGKPSWLEGELEEQGKGREVDWETGSRP